MAKDGSDIDPLLQNLVIPPPEHNDITILGPLEFKDRLLYGPLSHSQQDPCASSSSTNIVNLHAFQRSKTAPAGISVAANAINDPTHPNVRTTEQPGSKSIVRQAVALLVVYLSIGVLIYWLNRDGFLAKNHTHPVVDGLYFCIVTMCTIGYGDITPDSVATKLFSICFVLCGFGVMLVLFSSGMLTYIFHLQERCSYTMDREEGRVRTRVKVGLALIVLMLCLVFGVLIMHFVEKIGWLDSFYLSFMSVTTVGYGGREAFKTVTGRLLASIWLIVSTLSVVGALLYLAEARRDKRNRDNAKKVLGADMSISQFFAADIDNNGYLSTTEFLIYKLKEMGKITGEDIRPIINQFDKLDRTNVGRITL